MTNTGPNRDAELYVESERTLGIGPIHVATDQRSEPNVELDPGTGAIDVGAGSPAVAGEVVVEANSTNRPAGTLSATDDAGSVELHDPDGNLTVSMDASGGTGKIELLTDEDPTVKVGDDANGGEVAVLDTFRNEQLVVADVSDGSGRLRVLDDRERVTGLLSGSEAALLLGGPPETGPSGSTEYPQYGGGELLIRERTDAERMDVHVHATAEEDSDYGVEAGNRPRILLDGPEATLELGRERLGRGREGANGELLARDNRGDVLLELWATTNGTAEVVFSWSDDGTVIPCGKIRAEEEGLVVTDEKGNDLLRITKLGFVETATTIQQF